MIRCRESCMYELCTGYTAIFRDIVTRLVWQSVGGRLSKGDNRLALLSQHGSPVSRCPQAAVDQVAQPASRPSSGERRCSTGRSRLPGRGVGTLPRRCPFNLPTIPPRHGSEAARHSWRTHQPRWRTFRPALPHPVGPLSATLPALKSIHAAISLL
jgi:hypothetical protein